MTYKTTISLPFIEWLPLYAFIATTVVYRNNLWFGLIIECRVFIFSALQYSGRNPTQKSLKKYWKHYTGKIHVQ
jgi:hypothetical protein